MMLRKLTPREISRAGRYTWFILKAAPQREYVVQSILAKMGVTAFVPSEFRWRKRHRAQRSPEKREFPAYKSVVFVGQGKKPLPWYEFEGVRSILGCYTNPATRLPSVVKLKDIKQVMRAARTPLFELHDTPEEPLELFGRGDEVRITDGLLFGEEMTIAEVSDGMATFYKEMLGRSVPIRLPVEALQLRAKAA